jgi:translation initiation factor IF-2
MRVYEVAKQYDVSSKDIIALLEKNSITVKSHMSLLDDKALAVIDSFFTSTESVSEPYAAKVKESDKKIITTKGDTIQKQEDPTGQKKQMFESVPAKTELEHNTEVQGTKKYRTKVHSADAPAISEVELRDMLVEEFTQQAQIPASQVIIALLKWGVVATKNQIIGKDIVSRLAQHFSIPIKEIKSQKKEKLAVAKGEFLELRAPVVVVLGHVDHGKTTLLDFIRKTKVASREKGGITQHLGAYQVEIGSATLVFLDTPGHEAFSKIRQRGARVADIAILVVAADDGVKPQTVEVIKVIREMDMPLVVALNKVDRVQEAQIEATKQQLTQYGVVPEEWGGDTTVVSISAKTGLGVDTLLEVLSLQSQIMDLKADKTQAAEGYVLESKLEKGRGSTATIILQNGTLSKGDYFSCGNTVGRVTSIVDTFNHSLQSVGPSLPVAISGFEKMPDVGDSLVSLSKQTYLETKSEFRKGSAPSSSTLYQTRIVEKVDGEVLSFVLKADTNSSREALVDAIETYVRKEGQDAIIVSSSVGMIYEGDVELAYNTGSVIFGLHTKVDSKAATLAAQKKISIYCFDIIYRLLDAVHELFESRKKIEYERIKMGTATVIKVFQVKKVGEVAGCLINSGKFVRGGIVVVFRGQDKLGESKVVSLQKEKESVPEVRAGFECGIVLAQRAFHFQEGDRIECYTEEEKK